MLNIQKDQPGGGGAAVSPNLGVRNHRKKGAARGVDIGLRDGPRSIAVWAAESMMLEVSDRDGASR